MGARPLLILAFDTSAAHCAAALLEGNQPLAARRIEMRRGQAEALFPMLEDLLAAAGKVWADLGALAVGVGPGNFTGVRISVAAARGLALGLAVPAIGVTRFETAALDRRCDGDAEPVTVTIEAGRGERFAQDCRAMRACAAPRRIESAADGAAPAQAAAPEPPADLAIRIGRVAAMRLAAGDDIARPAPCYLRPADALPPSDPAPRILP